MNDGKVVVSLFLPKTVKEVVLTENGKILDRYCTLLKGEQDLSGNFRLTGNFINKDEIYKLITEGVILKVRNEFGEDEIFRITTVTPTPFIISVIAFQITITDTKTLWLGDVRPTNCNGLSALNYLYQNSESMGFPKEIMLSSDIDITSTAYYQLMTLHDALFNCDQSFINRWGGEVYRHQYNLTINKQIGQDNGVPIRENKNLVGFEANRSTDELCTVAIGKGYDGILGDYIESPLKDKYDRAYVKVIEYSDVKVKTDSDINEDDETMLFDTLEEAKAELNKRIKYEFKINKIDEIQATYDIDFLELSKTEEYKDYVQAERLYLGDFLYVIVDSLDIRIKTRIISKEIDYLQGRVTKMTASNIPTESLGKTDSQIVANIRNMLNKNNNIDLSNYVDTVIKGGMKNSNVIVRQNEILIMDTNDPKTAKNVWKWNGGALAHSSSGYNGKYVYGITQDGAINASIIQTGILSTVLIQNSDGSFQIDLSGTGGAKYFNNGNLAMEMKNNGLSFFDWEGTERSEPVGRIYSTRTSHDSNKPGLAIGHYRNSTFDIVYQGADGTFYSLMTFDKDNVLGGIVPIIFNNDTSLKNNILYFGDKEQSELFHSVSNNLTAGISNAFRVFHKKTGNTIFHVEGVEAGFADWQSGNYYAYFGKDFFTLPGIWLAKGDSNIWTDKNFKVDKNFHVNGNLTCAGTKNRVVNTDHYGKLKLNAYETTECYFGDVGRSKLVNGKCILRLDPKFLETVNTNINYEVRTWAYGPGMVWVETKDMYAQYVIVKGTNDIEFGYEVIAKQKDYENIRLEDVV